MIHTPHTVCNVLHYGLAITIIIVIIFILKYSLPTVTIIFACKLYIRLTNFTLLYLSLYLKTGSNKLFKRSGIKRNAKEQKNIAIVSGTASAISTRTL